MPSSAAAPAGSACEKTVPQLWPLQRYSASRWPSERMMVPVGAVRLWQPGQWCVVMIAVGLQLLCGELLQRPVALLCRRAEFADPVQASGPLRSL